MRSGTTRYLPVVYLGLSLALTVALLPTALRPPPSQPPTTAQFNPDAPPEDNPEVVLTELGQGSTRTAGAGPETPGELIETDEEPPPALVAPRSGACFGNPPRQVESLYAPPCVPAFVGDNGGATWQGVTPTEIRIAMPGDSRFEGAVEDEPRADEDTAQRTRRVYQEYFNKNFELYGRKVRFYVIGSDSSRDAIITADEEFDAFGVISLNFGAEDEAVRRGLVYWGGTHNTKEFFREHAPYGWSFLMDGTTDLIMSAELMCKQLVGKPVSFSGDPRMQGQPRKIGGIFYTAPNHPNSKGTTEEAMVEQCGERFTDTVTYNFDDDAGTVATGVTRLRAAGVTTIFCWCDYLTTITWTRTATNQGYFPEWVTQGGNTKDENSNGRTYDQVQWGNSIHLSASELPRPEPERDYYRAYKSIDPDGVPAREPYQGGRFYQLLHFVGGIQMAGPNLTPETFRDGMWKRWPRRPPEPSWSVGGGYGPDDFTYADYMGLLWWDPNAPDPFQPSLRGAYRWVYEGKRFTIGELPTDLIPFFEEGITRAPPE